MYISSENDKHLNKIKFYKSAFLILPLEYKNKTLPSTCLNYNALCSIPKKERYLTFTNDSRESINRLNGYGNGYTKCWKQSYETRLLRGNIKLTLLLHLPALMASNG